MLNEFIMDTYTIKHPYWGKLLKNGFMEIEIQSENLLYSEIHMSHAGLQCKVVDETDAIKHKCRQIADLIREIDKLNNQRNTNNISQNSIK
jgi:hypothetical protein